jgi:hypothetical protein
VFQSEMKWGPTRSPLSTCLTVYLSDYPLMNAAPTCWARIVA